MSEILKTAQAREFAFRQHLKPQIQFRGAVASSCGLVATLINFWSDLRQEQNVDIWSSERSAPRCKDYVYYLVGYNFEFADPRTPYFVSNLLIISALFIFIILCIFGYLKKLRKVIWWESAFCITGCIVVVLLPFASSDLVATLVFSGDDSDFRCSWNYLNDQNTNTPFLRTALFLDVITTVIALYMPIRFIAMLPIFLLGNLSYLSCACFITASTVSAEVVAWFMPAISLLLLGMAAGRGAHDQDLLRWQTWQAKEDLHKSFVFGVAMERIATSFCDLVIPLTPDFRLQSDESSKCQSFFGSDCACSLFTDFLSISDASRFNAMVTQTRETNAPGCLSVTLHSRGGNLPLEVNLLVVLATSGSFVLGISQISEQELPVTDVALKAPPTSLGHSDAHSDTHTSLQHDSVANSHESKTGTEIVFSEGDLERIRKIGQSEHWLIPEHLFTINFNEVLGEGKQSIVYTGTFCNNGVAVKYAKHQDGESPNIAHNGKQLLSAARELRAFRHVRHPNIVLFHGACITKDSLVLVLEVVKGQTLQAFVAKRQVPVTLTNQQQLMLDICSALWYLSLQQPYPIVHGDLKPANIMVEVRVPGVGADIAPHAKLIDFGLSRILSPRAKPLGGTIHWRAPETLVGGNPKGSADMFSFGCIVFFIMTAKKPYSLSRDETLDYIRDHVSLPPLPWPPSSITCQYDKALIELCCSCTSLEPEARPTWPKVKALIILSSQAAELYHSSSPPEQRLKMRL